MKYGYFDNQKKEYVIDTPKTPLPWINYLGNESFFTLISNTCGGYSFHKDAKLRRLTRYRYNNLPMDQGGRYYYIKEGSTIFNPGFLPTKTPLDFYSCRHGLGYSIFKAIKNDVECELTCFVPLQMDCQIDSLKIKNTSDKEKTLSLYSLTEWCLYNTVDDSTNFQRNFNIGELEVQDSTIYHLTEYRERRNHFAFFNVSCPIDGFDTKGEDFFGQFNGFDSPKRVLEGTSSNTIAHGWAPIASHRIDLTLKPGQERRLVFTLGYIENDKDHKFDKDGKVNKQKALNLIEQTNKEGFVETQLKKLASYWDSLLSNFELECDDSRLSSMVNIWNQYQCMVTFNLSRSASYFESGVGRGMGFRDSCQDLLGFVHLISDKARQRILDIASIQFEDGSTYHQYQPLDKKGNADVGSGFNDDPLWLVACTSAYLKETGDYSILSEMVDFDNDSTKAQPLLEHLRRSINYTNTHLGPHGLPLIGRADWNDCLNLNCHSETPGESFQTCSNFDTGKAESVFIAAMYVKYAKEYAQILQHLGLNAEVEHVLLSVQKMEEAVIKNGWDGQWFLRAYDAFENKIGSKENKEGKIFIEPQGFCTMAGIGKSLGFGKKALESTQKYLVNDFGVELLSPCFKTYQKSLGEITSYPPGYKENGSIFCHNNNWITLAYCEEEDAEKAFDIYTKHCPAFIEDKSEIHRTEPYVYSQTIAGREAPTYGEAKNSWLTGTAAWSFVAISQGILGIRPDFDGLCIHTCLPKSIKSFKVRRKYRGATYIIEYENKSNGPQKIYVDGVFQDSEQIGVAKEGSTVSIKVQR